MSQRSINTGKRTPVRPSAVSKVRKAASASSGLTPEKRVKLTKKKPTASSTNSRHVPTKKTLQDSHLPPILSQRASVIASSITEEESVPIPIPQVAKIEDFRNQMDRSANSIDLGNEITSDNDDDSDSSVLSEEDIRRRSSPETSANDAQGNNYNDNEDDNDNISEKRFRMKPDDSDDEEQDMPKIGDLASIISVTNPDISKISRMAMRKTWLALHPNVVNVIVSTLELYLEQSIISSGIPFTEDQQSEIRDSIRKLIMPVSKKFKTIRLPPDVSEFQFDEERLQAEKNRLSLSVSANSTQADSLKEDYLRALGQLEREERLFKELEKNFKVHRKEVEKSLKELEADIKNLGRSGNLPPHNLTNIARVSAEKINLGFLEEVGSQKRSYYDPDEDETLQRVLGSLHGQLDVIGENVAPVESLSGLVDRVNTLLQLAME